MPLENWTDFFLGSAGAAAALAGLVVVAISVNLERILSFAHLPARAAATVGAFVLTLVVSLLCLAPQSAPALGVEVIVAATLAWALQLFAARHTVVDTRAGGRPAWERIFTVLRGQAQALPFIVGGALLVAGQGSAPYWLLAGVAITLVAAMTEVWVLLVEILR